MDFSCLLDLPGVQGVGLRPFVRIPVKPFDVGLELPAINSPNPAPSDLDRRKLARSHQRIHLGDAHVEVVRHVLESHESRFDAEILRAGGGGGVVHVMVHDNTCSSRIRDFGFVCACLTPLASRGRTRGE